MEQVHRVVADKRQNRARHSDEQMLEATYLARPPKQRYQSVIATQQWQDWDKTSLQ